MCHLPYGHERVTCSQDDGAFRKVCPPDAYPYFKNRATRSNQIIFIRGISTVSADIGFRTFSSALADVVHIDALRRVWAASDEYM